ncbi:MAG TPA: EAL domain-containing protein [Thermoleophilaceae bacterium]|jgi:PAS domain S-box-containing protein
MADEQDVQTQEPADLAEVALGVTQEQLQRYEAQITHFLSGDYLSVGPDGKVIAWTRAAEKRFGWAAGEMTGEELSTSLVPPDGHDAARELIDPIVRGEKSDPAGATLQLETHRRDGSRLTTEVAFVPIRMGDGYHLNLALQDIITHKGNPVEMHRMKKRHADVLRLIVTALDGGELPKPLGDDGMGERVEERWHPRGALVIFDATPVAGEEPVPGEDAAGGAALPGGAAGSSRPAGGQSESEVLWLRSENERLRSELQAAQAEAGRLRAVVPEGPGVQPDLDDPTIGPADIESALRDDGFSLHGQPVLDLATDAIAQHELLLRMTAADGGLILPQAFFGVARRAGLTGAIDQWVVRRAVRTIAEQAQVGRDITLEVNLSAESLHDAALLPTIERELMSTGIDPARLVLEVPERVAIDDPDAASRVAKRLRAMGCSFALDDFGTSFGSFRFLKDLPVDYLKIDGDLIVTLTESRTAQLVVKALVDLAKGTGAQTIAVFASDDEALRMLKELGVGYAQGHKVGRPRPLADALSAVEAPALRAVDGAQAAAGTANLAT